MKKSRYGVFYELLIKNRILTLMTLPSILYVFLFNYVPMAGIIIAFKNYVYSKGIFGSDWVGFDNFAYLFLAGTIYRVTLNTVVYNIAFLATDICLQVLVAVILSEVAGRYFRKISQTILLMPFFISWVVAGAIAYNLLSYDTGFINHVLISLGRDKINFMNNPAYWPFLFVMFHTWKGLGYGSVIYLAAITGIDKEISEAAGIDGANIFQRIRYIVLPSLRVTVITLVLLGLGNIIRGDFAMFYNLTGNNALLFDVSDIVDTFVYRSLMQSQNFGMSAAAGIYQSVLGFAIIMMVNTIIKKVQPEYALF